MPSTYKLTNTWAEFAVFAFNRDVSGNKEFYTPIYYALLVNSINLMFDKLLTNTYCFFLTGRHITLPILTKSNFKSATNTILYFMNITYRYITILSLILKCPYFTNTILINKCVIITEQH